MHRQGSISKLAIMLMLAFVFVAQPSWAGRIVKVKGKRVFIILDQEELNSTFKGDNLYTTTPSGQKRGVVTVRAIRGNQVIAQLRKGKAAKSMLTKPRKASKKKKKQKRDDSMEMEDASEVAITEKEDRSEFPEMMFGIMGTYGQVTQNVANVADMSGSLIGFKAVFDYELFSGLGVMARLGMDMMSVTGSNGGTTFQTDINYLTLDFFLRYYFMRTKSFGIYGNFGFGIYSPMSTDLGSNAALQEDSISTTSLLIPGLGISIPLGGVEVQLGADYYYFPPSEDVKTNAFGARLGILFGL